MSDFEAIETREQFEEAVKDRLEQERETVRREFSGCLSPEAVEEKYKSESNKRKFSQARLDAGNEQKKNRRNCTRF